MSETVIQVDKVWKKYRLGVLGTGTLRHDFNRWWHRIRGKRDPYAKIGQNEKAEGRKLKAEIGAEDKAEKAEASDTKSQLSPPSPPGEEGRGEVTPIPKFQLSAFPISNLSSD